MAADHGPAIGAYAAALLDIPLPWTKMRQVYALLGLVKRWGADRVDAACASALEHEAVNVGLIGRMLERATEHTDRDVAAGAPSSPAASPATPTTSLSALNARTVIQPRPLRPPEAILEPGLEADLAGAAR